MTQYEGLKEYLIEDEGKGNKREERKEQCVT